MQVQDKGVIFSLLKHSESSLVVRVLSENNGVYCGYVKWATSKKNTGLYQVGNLISFVWSSRDPNSLGYLKAELIKSYSLYIFEERANLYIFEALANLIQVFLPERESETDLYGQLIEILRAFEQAQEPKQLLKSYVLFEQHLLETLGIGLDLSRCAGGGDADDLLYVSPKTGRAVSKEKGEPYKDKLLKLPQFLLKDNVDFSKQDLTDALRLTSYFLHKNLQEHHSQSKFNKIALSHRKIMSLL